MASRGVNKVILVGNLGRDPEVRYLESGAAVANFTLATTESFRNREGGQTQKTEWHNIVMWRGLAETAGKYLKKGSSVYLEGRIINRSWDDPEGNKKYRTEIEANNMIMLDSRPSGGGGSFEKPPISAYSQGGGGTSTPTPPANSGGAVSQPQVSNPAEVKKEEAADDLPF